MSQNDRLLKYLHKNPGLKKLIKRKGPYPLSSTIEEALLISALYHERKRPILVVKKNLYGAQRLYERISSLTAQENCALFSVDESLRVEAIASSPENRASQVETLASLLKNPNQIVITGVTGFTRFLPQPEVFADACIDVKVGEILNMEELKRKLRQGGYSETAHIDQPLSFAARGGIVDVYSINYEQPIRIEFFDDEVDSIRFFDITSQNTVITANEVHIVPASAILFSDDDIDVIRQRVQEALNKENNPALTGVIETDMSYIEQHISESDLYGYLSYLDHPASLLSYMQDPLVICSDRTSIDNAYRHIVEETTVYIQEMVQENKKLPRFTMWHDLPRLLDQTDSMNEDPFEDHVSGIEELSLPNISLGGKLKMLNDGHIVWVMIAENEVERVLKACIDAQVPYRMLSGEDMPEVGINIEVIPMAEGFRYDAENLVVVTSKELFSAHHHAGRFENKFKNAEMIHGYDELSPGDYIVHSQYGVGQYVGIETREVLGSTRDFLKIIYRGDAELLVPLEQFNLVRKFVSREGVVPRLNKLGSGDWEKTRKRLEENVENIAGRLVELYATRTEDIGYAYQPDSELQTQFENEFEYELTLDQAKAVHDVKRDMEMAKPMDRLICGDVGFGKTEIAIRAAFKAASENKQVAVLCPTTILAEQHFRTFCKRFENYPFELRCLDRFVTPSQVQQTLTDLKEGRVDIVIGTHRILSADVEFKDLGLLVVDEEHRFGVEHKERIKEMKNGVDVLTLSATPIPRTLQMSLVGIRSMSQLETPPANRYTVQTYVVEKNLGLVSDAIERELARDGQVFYLYNNIDEIYHVARTLQERVPDANIGIAHGKMGREEIEDVMFRFINHEINVLVCTTIIENGIDIPNANTIFIDNAQNFGLAQIYQIKGRVGRSDRAAYAYLLIPPRRSLNETAQKRLQAVKEFATLGSGYKIAMRDLTIRGAGDLLGPNQSGFIDTVGIDMYIEMLEEAIQKKKGIKKERKQMKKANVAQSGYIPKKFAPDDYDKISMYQKIDRIFEMDELEIYKKDVIDQYGRLPEEVAGLFEKRKLDILVNSPDIEGYKEIRNNCEVTFSKDFSNRIDGVKLFEMYSKISKDIALRYANQCITASVPKNKDSLSLTIKMIESAKEALREN